MLGTSAIRNLIRENKIAQMYSAIQTGNSMGMQTLDQNLADLVRRNMITRRRSPRQGQVPRELPGLSARRPVFLLRHRPSRRAPSHEPFDCPETPLHDAALTTEAARYFAPLMFADRDHRRAAAGAVVADRAQEIHAQTRRPASRARLRFAQLWGADRYVATAQRGRAAPDVRLSLDFVTVPVNQEAIGQDELGDYMIVVLEGILAVDRIQPWGGRSRLAEARAGRHARRDVAAGCRGALLGLHHAHAVHARGGVCRAAGQDGGRGAAPGAGAGGLAVAPALAAPAPGQRAAVGPALARLSARRPCTPGRSRPESLPLRKQHPRGKDMERDQASKFINDLLRLMVTRGGSDLFLTADFPPAIKVDGRVTKVSPQPLTTQHTLALARSIMSDKQAAEFERTKECNFAVAPSGVGRFRVNAFVQQGSVGLVLRTIPATLPTIDGLGLPMVLKDVAMMKRGLVILVGATGSGKSTSLAAMVDHRNENSYGHIITIEDPVEFVQHRTRTASSPSARWAWTPTAGRPR